MKLFRHGAVGAERAGIIDQDGHRRDLSLLLPDITPEILTPARLGALKTVDARTLPMVAEDVRLGPPIAGIRQFIAVGLNYRKHAHEAKMAIPEEPLVFNKALTSLAGPNDDVPMPLSTTQMDWEVELAIVIGSSAYCVDPERALDHVAGYCLANDVSARDWQLHRNGQWTKGKSFPGFGPLGPFLVTSEELPDPQVVPLSLRVNGALRQNSNTSDMIFPVRRIVSYISQFMTLLPGDVIITGTPEGVGMGMSPPSYLNKGDVMELDGGMLGTQRQVVV
jgi:2,4-didehydro-3-deoxy-L-rhamnonate hydrolase